MIMRVPERFDNLAHFGSQIFIRGKRTGSLFGHFSSCLQIHRGSPPTAGPLVVIGSPCIAPPGRCDSPCKGKGACIWRWSRHNWIAAGHAAGRIQRAPLRRPGGGGSSRSPGLRMGSPAWRQRRMSVGVPTHNRQAWKKAPGRNQTVAGSSNKKTNRWSPLKKCLKGGQILRAEGLSDVDEAEQGRLAEQLHALARLHARLALQRGHEAQCAERWPRREVAGVGGPGEEAGVKLRDERPRGARWPRPGWIYRRKGCFRRAKVLRGVREKERAQISNIVIVNILCKK